MCVRITIKYLKQIYHITSTSIQHNQARKEKMIEGNIHSMCSS